MTQLALQSCQKLPNILRKLLPNILGPKLQPIPLLILTFPKVTNHTGAFLFLPNQIYAIVFLSQLYLFWAYFQRNVWLVVQGHFVV